MCLFVTLSTSEGSLDSLGSESLIYGTTLTEMNPKVYRTLKYAVYYSVVSVSFEHYPATPAAVAVRVYRLRLCEAEGEIKR